ncbi:MAG TPA: methyltransferase domain-containing protein [Candidatus Paceibacterota bacterium]
MNKIKIGNVEITEPRQIVYDILKYKDSGTVLDLGAGYGRHSLFLAHKGFKVTAVEEDEKALESLKIRANTLGVEIATAHKDIKDFESDRKYDVVIATMVLHFLNQNEVQDMLKKMQSWTAKGGINVVCAYTDQNIAKLRPYLFKVGELKEDYSGWEILEYGETWGDPLTKETLEYEKSLGLLVESIQENEEIKRRHTARLIARKI